MTVTHLPFPTGAEAGAVHHGRAIPPPVLRLTPESVVRGLAGLAGAIVLAGVAVEVVGTATGHRRLGGLGALVNLDGEANIPAFFSALMLVGLAVVLTALAVVRRQRGLSHSRHLFGLAAITGFLALDEAAAIHELLTAPLKGQLDIGPVGHFAWVAAYGVGALLVLALFVPAIPRVPRQVRRTVLIAVAVYVAGAIGCEMAAGVYLAGMDGYTHEAAYTALVAIEESLEMAGLIALVYAALVSLRDHAPRLSFQMGRPA